MNVFLTVFGKPRYLGLIETDFPVLVPGETLVIETARGEEIATVGGEISGEQAEMYLKNNDEGPRDSVPGGDPGLQSVTFVRKATEDDIALNRESRKLEESVLIRARQILAEHSLGIKIVDVEYFLDRKKLFFYFTSEQRVDFRSYVRDLAREFRTRIELRQIGVRDEAKVVKGIAPCGRPCCCGYWLHNFLPIGIKMVKEQNLALNPTKISGLCGRLMCCMSYEHQVYSDLWKKLPNPGSKIKGLQGNFILLGVDIKEENVQMRSPEGSYFSIKADDFPLFRERITQGGDWKSFVDGAEDCEDSQPPVAPGPIEKDDLIDLIEEEIPAAEENGEKRPAAPKRRRRKKRKLEAGDGAQAQKNAIQHVGAKPEDGNTPRPSSRRRKRRHPAGSREDGNLRGGENN